MAKRPIDPERIKKIGQARKPDTYDENIGALIRARRLELNISQEVLAENLGIAFQQLQKYEKGINRISASRLRNVCIHLRVSPFYFFPDLSEGGVEEAKLTVNQIRLLKISEGLSEENQQRLVAIAEVLRS